MTVLEEISANPFMVLGVTPKDSRAKLIARQAELALFDDTHQTDEALARLLHPANRLRAEIRWFPRTQSSALSPVRAFLQSGGRGPVPQIDSPSALAHFNAVRLALCTWEIVSEPDVRAAIHALAVLADALFPEQVTEEINEDRAEAGFAPLGSAAETETELKLLLSETVAACGTAARQSAGRGLARQLENDYKSRSSEFHNSFLVELAADSLKK